MNATKWKALAGTRLSDGQMAVGALAALALVGLFNASLHGAPPRSAPVNAHPRWHGLPEYNSDPAAGARMVETLCRKADGDARRLTPEELQWLDGISAGNAFNMIEMKARQYAQERQRARQRTAHPRSPRAGASAGSR